MKSIALFLALFQQDGTPFESKEYGVQLTIPTGWTIDASRQPHVMLKIHLKGDYVVAPEIAVAENRQAEPVTLNQYREQLRLLLLRTIKEVKIIDDRSSKAGPYEGFVMAMECKGAKDSDLLMLKGIWHLAPKHYLAIDGVAPKGNSDLIRASFEKAVKSIQFTPREGLKLDGTAKKWPEIKQPVKVNVKEELEVWAGDKPIGIYTLEIRDIVRDGVAGYEYAHVHRADYGKEGKEESSVRGFLSADATRQSVETTFFRVNQEARSTYITASAEVRDGKATIQRRINGEACESVLEIPSGTLLADLVEAAHHHLTELGKGLSAFPILNIHERHPILINAEALGRQSVKLNDKVVEITVVSIAQENRVLTYWYDLDRKPLRITGFGPSVVVRRKK